MDPCHSRETIRRCASLIEQNPHDIKAYLTRAAEYYFLGKIEKDTFAPPLK